MPRGNPEVNINVSKNSEDDLQLTYG